MKECLTLGLVTHRRSDDDARRFELALSAKGRKTLQAAADMSARHEAEIGATLNEDERATLIALLRKLLRHPGATAETTADR